MGHSQSVGTLFLEILYNLPQAEFICKYKKQMNFIFRFGSHPQVFSLGICRYSKIQKVLKSETF
jgi:hypothetical protein